MTDIELEEVSISHLYGMVHSTAENLFQMMKDAMIG